MNVLQPTEVPPSGKLINVPNALSVFRLIGSYVAMGLAIAGWSWSFFWLLLVLMMTDWVDGKIAIRWNQRTPFGARLDSVADASMYAAVLLGAIWLKRDVVLREWPWIAATLISYAITMSASLMKFGCFPSYHTRGAKTSWLLMTVAILALFADFSVWPLRVAMVGVTLTNVEATAITCILPARQTDVPSFWHARRRAAAILSETAAIDQTRAPS